MLFVFIGALGFITTASFSAAQADDCSNANSQMELNQCSVQAYKASNAELNQLYKQIEGRLKNDANTTKLLVSAQRAWVAFRDAECSFSSSLSADGSVYPMVVLMCRQELTRNRIKDFKYYLSCKDGDLSCPVPSAD